MNAHEKYFPILQKALERYEKAHPHWRMEVLVSLMRWALMSLHHYIEDVRDTQITWRNPFVQLPYMVDWNWEAPRTGDVGFSGITFGKITEKNTADKELARKTLAEIMARRLNTLALEFFTNGAWFEIKDNYQLPYLPVDLNTELNSIADKEARRAFFEQLVRPFSIGGGVIEVRDNEIKNGARISERLAKKLANMRNALGIRRIGFTAEVNGRKIEMSLIFQVHPLIANYDEKRAYFPTTIGLFIEPRISGNTDVTKTPADWPLKDRKVLWKKLFAAMDKLVDQLIPKVESQDSVILKVNAELKVPASCWQPEVRSSAIKWIADAFSQSGVLEKIEVARAHGGGECATCGWIHDKGFTQINTGEGEPISLGGVLPEIVRVVHENHEKGFRSLSSKDENLGCLCGGYGHPCKAFDDLKHRDDYKRLFDTSRRGFIALRGAVGMIRNKTEPRPE